jgi:hypothetical protein
METLFKSLPKIILYLFLLFPCQYIHAQETGSAAASFFDDVSGDDKKKKKDFLELGFDKLSVSFFVRMMIDILSVLILIRLIYYPIYRKKDFFFTFFLFNIVIFIITYLLNKVDLSMGAAFGLFAVFSLLRYRTENISAKDMTYLFIVIALGLISAVNKGTFIETSIINAIILLVAYALDANLFMKNENTQEIQYENIDLIRPENRTLLLEDLRNRTGLNIHKLSVGKVNFLRDSAIVTIYYYPTDKRN